MPIIHEVFPNPQSHETHGDVLEDELDLDDEDEEEGDDSHEGGLPAGAFLTLLYCLMALVTLSVVRSAPIQAVSNSPGPSPIICENGFPYRIAPGDTLSFIGDFYGLTPEEIAAANPKTIIDINMISEGDTICVPTTELVNLPGLDQDSEAQTIASNIP